MEIVVVKEVKELATKTKTGQSMYSVCLEDGRKGLTFAKDSILWKGEMGLVLKESKEFNGEQQYFFSLPKPENGRSARNLSFDMRKFSLQSAIQMANLSKEELDADKVFELADRVFEYYNR